MTPTWPDFQKNRDFLVKAGGPGWGGEIISLPLAPPSLQFPLDSAFSGRAGVTVGKFCHGCSHGAGALKFLGGLSQYLNHLRETEAISSFCSVKQDDGKEDILGN